MILFYTLNQHISSPFIYQERLRLRNIRRNEARLAQLGLLIPIEGSQGESQQSALTSTLLTTKKRGRPKSYKKRTKSLEPTRLLPRRHAKITKFDPSFERKIKPTRKYTRKSQDDYSDDDSMPPTPIQLSKIIKPQSHQKDFHDDKKFYLKQRRNRRGRPKREEYIYVCEEECCYCGGGWGEVRDVALGGVEMKDEEKEKKVVSIDMELLDDDTAKLVRCKDCRMAFHPGCLKLNGVDCGREQVACLEEIRPLNDVTSTTVNSEVASTSVEEERTEIEIGNDVEPIPADAEASCCRTDTANEVTTSSEEANVPMELESEAHEMSLKANSNDTTNVTSGTTDCNNVASSDSAAAAAAPATEDNDVVMEFDNETEANSGLSNKADLTAGESMHRNDATALSDAQNGVQVESKSPGKGEEAAQEETIPRRPHRIPNRCSKCDAMRQLGIEPDADENSNEAENSSPAKKRSVFKLEAIVNDKTVLCSVEPAPVLEADMAGKTIVCHVVFGGCSDEMSRGLTAYLDTSNAKKPPAAAVKVKQKTKQPRGRPSDKMSDPIARKVEKLILKASDCIEDVEIQEASIVELQKFVDGASSTTSAVKAGGLELLSNAMSNHKNVAQIQVESIRTMTEIIWYCQSLGVVLVDFGCLDLTVASMEDHGTNAEVQQLGCELFRALTYDSQCCHAMIEADIVTAVMESMKRNPKELDVLAEAR